MPDNLQFVGVNGNLINSPAMTVVHRQSPHPGVRILLLYFALLIRPFCFSAVGFIKDLICFRDLVLFELNRPRLWRPRYF